MTRIAAVMAASAFLTAGCAPAQSEGPAVAPRLVWSAPLAEDFDALPRVADDTPEAREINAYLDRIDVSDRAERADCLAGGRDNVEWGRTVKAPMTGPRFVSVLLSTGYYCGGAHPSWGQKSLTFDLESGRLVDWAGFLPDDMALPRYQAGDQWPQLLRSSSLKARYAREAIAQRRMPEGEDECAEVLMDSEPLDVWPDARTGGLALQVSGLAHAVSACTETVVMPLAELRQRGVDPALIDALETAHRTGQWRPLPPEDPRD
ncbi:MAG: hypothetical protein K0M78_11200 [Brevundimonas sp.]|nr:hypothetical protein [Brevundimonas sp.]